MDVLQLLIADHNRLRGLFTRYKAAHEAEETDQAQALATTIMRELEVHTTIEEEVFYPAVTDLSEDIHETVVEGIEEHHVAETLIEEIKALEPSDEHWAAKMTVLIENVEHHAEEEETDLFPDVRSEAEDRFLDSLGVRLEERKRELGAPTVADKIDLSEAELDERARSRRSPGAPR